jgi:predicted nucleic acid-binding Zn ribbon protein
MEQDHSGSEMTSKPVEERRRRIRNMTLALFLVVAIIFGGFILLGSVRFN